MPENQVPSQSQDVLYQPGISFKNPKVVRPATIARAQPWFEGPVVPGPLSASSKLKRWENVPDLKRYNAIWNRNAKQRTVEKLGAYFHDVPTMSELGSAPPATSETASVTRSPLGFLDNLVKIGTNVATGVTNILQTQAEQKRQTALAQTQSLMQHRFLPSGDNMWLWVAGAGVIGLGAFFFLRR